MDAFTCKIIIIRSDEKKYMKQKILENNRSRGARVGEIKRCLFGVANLEDTEKMVQEQYEIDRKRFSERFGIDLRKIERSENESNSENIVSNNSTVANEALVTKKSVIGRRVMKRSREVFRQHNSQTVLTDFYQARKTVQSIEKSSKDTKEN